MKQFPHKGRLKGLELLTWKDKTQRSSVKILVLDRTFFPKKRYMLRIQRKGSPSLLPTSLSISCKNAAFFLCSNQDRNCGLFGIRKETVPNSTRRKLRVKQTVLAKWGSTLEEQRPQPIHSIFWGTQQAIPGLVLPFSLQYTETNFLSLTQDSCPSQMDFSCSWQHFPHHFLSLEQFPTIFNDQLHLLLTLTLPVTKFGSASQYVRNKNNRYRFLNSVEMCFYIKIQNTGFLEAQRGKHPQ